MQIVVNGRLLCELGPWDLGDWSTELRGSDDLSWTMRQGRPHPYLRAGMLVELYDGPARVWYGRLDQPDLASGQLQATGLFRQAYDVPALDGGGAPTSVANDAIDAAITRGALPGWKRTGLVSTAAMSTDLQGEAPSIGELLDVLADHEGKWWRVQNDGDVELYSRPPNARWLVSASAGALGLAEADYASTIQGRRRSGASTWVVETYTDTAAASRFGAREGYEDLTHMGQMTQARVLAVLGGQASKGRARYGFTNSVPVSTYQLMSAGGVPAHLPAVRGGDVARFAVQPDQSRFLVGAGFVEEMIGRVIHHPRERYAEIQPADLALGVDMVDTLAYFAERKPRRRRRRR